MTDVHISAPKRDLVFYGSELTASYHVFNLHHSEKVPFAQITVYRNAKPIEHVEDWMWRWIRAEEEVNA